MQTTYCRATFNRNQERPGKAEAYPGGSRQALGRTVGNPAQVRAGTTHTARAGDDHAPPDPGRRLGGQHAAPGFFGLPGERRAHTDRPQVPSRAEAKAVRDRADKVASEQTRQFNAHLAAKYPAKAATTPAPAPASKPEPAQAPILALHLKLRRDRFEAFLVKAEREVRPIEDVLTEYLADLGNHVQQEQLAEVYEEDTPPTPPVTQGMRLARHAAEEAERSLYVDDEACEEARRYAGAGYVDIQLAID